MLDIDHFKRINDSHGHDVGDRVLKAVADAFRRELRDSDVLGRLGGEEFGIILPNTSGEGAAAVGERLRARIDAMRLSDDWEGEITPKVSVGVACVQGASRIEDLIKRADQALYAAKAAGRNRVYAAGGLTGSDDSCFQVGQAP